MRSLRIHLTLVVAAAGLPIVAPSVAAATAPGSPGRIAYAAEPSASEPADIFTRRRDGTGVRRLTRTARYVDRDPSWSPDGRQIVWSCHGEETEGDPRFYMDVCLMDADGSDKVRFGFETSVKSPVFSPDGTRIAYATDGADAEPVLGELTEPYPNDEIFVMDLDGSDRVRVTSNSLSEAALAWSPEGDRLAFAAVDGEGEGALYVVEVATGEERLVAADVYVASSYFNTGWIRSSQIDWSPEGDLVAVAREMDDQAIDLVIVDVSSGDEIRLTDEGPSDYSFDPVWSPSGSKVMYRHMGEGSSGGGWTCLVSFPLAARPAGTDHRGCPGGRSLERDLSWQARPRR